MYQSTTHGVGRPRPSARPKQRNKRISRIGKVVFDGQDTAIQCAVREFSETHAVLTMSGWMGFPSEFTLFVEPDSIRAQCQVKRRRGSTIEVSFLGVEQCVRLRAR